MSLLRPESGISSWKAAADCIDVVCVLHFRALGYFGNCADGVGLRFVNRLTVLIEILIGQLGRLGSIKVLCLVVYRSADLGRKLSQDHFLDYVINGYRPDSFLYKGEHFRREFALALDTVQDC